MTIDKLTTYHAFGTEEFEVTCDKCGHADEYEVSGWDDLMEQMKDDGWRSSKVDGEWKHMCAECS